MKEQIGYIPPRYIPLGQSDHEPSDLETSILPTNDQPPSPKKNDVPLEWSSGICACFDDLQSCKLTSSLFAFYFHKLITIIVMPEIATYFHFFLLRHSTLKSLQCSYRFE